MSSQHDRLSLIPYSTNPATGEPSVPAARLVDDGFKVAPGTAGMHTEAIDVRGVDEITFHVYITAGSAGTIQLLVLGNGYSNWERTGAAYPLTRINASNEIVQDLITVDIAALAAAENPAANGILSFDVHVDCRALGVVLISGKTDDSGIEHYIEASVKFTEGNEPFIARTGVLDRYRAMRLGELTIV